MAKKRVDLLVGSSNETVTVPTVVEDSDTLGVIDDGGIVVNHGRIVQAAATKLLERRYAPKRTVSANGMTILPGFVDPHTHLVFSSSREDEFQQRVAGVHYMQSLRKGGGIIETVERTRQATPEQLYKRGIERLNMALNSGTTTIEVKTGYGLNLYYEQKMLDAISRLAEDHSCNIVPTFLGAHAVPHEYQNPEDYVNHVIRDMIPMAKKHGLAKFCDVFCEKDVFTPNQSIRILKAAVASGLKTKIHADEFSDSGGSRVANTIPTVSADHLVHAPTEELEKMVNTGVIPVLLPGSSHSLLMPGYAPVREMLSLGLPVALGTDFSPANWMLSQITVAALAARDLRMRVEEIIRGITTNAARALRLHDQAGSIRPGRSADFVILNAPNHKWVGYVHSADVVNKVLIRGNVIVDQGKP